MIEFVLWLLDLLGLYRYRGPSRDYEPDDRFYLRAFPPPRGPRPK